MATEVGQQLGLQESKMEDDIDVKARAAAFVDAPDGSPNGTSGSNGSNGSGLITDSNGTSTGANVETAEATPIEGETQDCALQPAIGRGLEIASIHAARLVGLGGRDATNANERL